jgi:hypothetical protein
MQRLTDYCQRGVAFQLTERCIERLLIDKWRTLVMNNMASRLEFLEGNPGSFRENEYIPVLIPHYVWPYTI